MKSDQVTEIGVRAGGFEIPKSEPGRFYVPNEYLDEILGGGVPTKDIKTWGAILSRTLGRDRTEAEMSVAELAAATATSERRMRESLARLAARGVISMSKKGSGVRSIELRLDFKRPRRGDGKSNA